MEDDLSFSFYCDSGKSPPGQISRPNTTKSVTPTSITACTPPDPSVFSRQKEIWESDSANCCKKCQSTFRIYRRRHHCRNCAGIFCDHCTRFRSLIPRVISKIPSRTGKEEVIDYKTEVRLCEECSNFYKGIHDVAHWFMIFAFLPLTIEDYKNITSVCKQWKMIGEFYLSKFRSIQYKLPHNKYNKWEKMVLHENRFILTSHSSWIPHVLRSHETPSPRLLRLYFGKENEKRKGCWCRMCSRSCKADIDEESSLPLFSILPKESNLLSQKLVSIYNALDSKLLECYLPFILSRGMHNRDILDFIWKQCSQNIRIANYTFWFLKRESPILFSNLIEILPQEVYARLIKVEVFSSMCKITEITEGKILDKAVSPTRPELGEQEVLKGITVKESATRPILIPLTSCEVLYKKDDLRKDYLIICIIRIMENILQEESDSSENNESKKENEIVTYDVLPTSDSDGFIDIVPNCETLYAISEKTNIVNYLLNHNPDTPVCQLRKRFRRSCAIYSAISYLLSISDRNSENLMLTHDGNFFEIDYSYCLGNEPKAIRPSCIRITSQMLDALGGEGSEEYNLFLEEFVSIYDILRRHVNTVICILSLLPAYKSTSRTSPNLENDAMMNEILKRFNVAQTTETAIQNLKTKIEESVYGASSTKYHVIDFFHKLNKEKTITTYIELGYTSTTGLLGAMYGSMYSYFS